MACFLRMSTTSPLMVQLKKLVLHLKHLNPFSSSPVFTSTPPNLSSTPWTFRTLQLCRTNFNNLHRNPRNHCSWHSDRTPTFEKNFCMDKAAQTENLVEQIFTLPSKHAQFILCRDSANETIIHLATSSTPPPDTTPPSSQHFILCPLVRLKASSEPFL